MARSAPSQTALGTASGPTLCNARAALTLPPLLHLCRAARVPGRSPPGLSPIAPGSSHRFLPQTGLPRRWHFPEERVLALVSPPPARLAATSPLGREPGEQSRWPILPRARPRGLSQCWIEGRSGGGAWPSVQHCSPTRALVGPATPSYLPQPPEAEGQ